MELDNRSILVVQIALSLVAWSSIAAVLVWPQLARLERRRALRWVIAPQMLRHIGMSLLGTGVTGPGMPADFASWVATGDLIVMLTATSAFWALGRSGRAGLVLAALATLIGAADLLHNLRMGLVVHAADHLGAAWPVVAIVVPMMLVAHVLAAVLLARRETWRGA
jgi:hypothetical protein